jgi:hypothetical protein
MIQIKNPQKEIRIVVGNAIFNSNAIKKHVQSPNLKKIL